MKQTDLISAPSRGSPEQVIAYAKAHGALRIEFLEDYLTELWRLCQKYGFDFAVAVAQSANETDEWRSAAWRDFGNPAGLNITNAANMSRAYKNGTEAARAHIVHLWAYNRGRIPAGHELEQYTELSPSYANGRVFTTKDVAGNLMGGTVKTLADFNVNGRWALLPPITSPTATLPYGNRIITNGNRIFGSEAQQPPTGGGGEKPVAAISYGNVAHPPFENREVPPSKKFGAQVAQRIIRAVIWHTMYGTLWGTDGWFHAGNALTDYGVGVQATDGAENAGKLLRWNDPRSTWYAHASGTVDNPIGDAKKFIDLYGVGRWNPDTVPIEISGSGATPLDAKARATIVQLTAYWADSYGKYLFEKYGEHRFTFEMFPFIPSENGRSFVCYHGEANAGKRNSCPNAAVRAQTDAMFAEIKAILRAAQTSGVEEPEPEPEPGPGPTYAPRIPIPELAAVANETADTIAAVITTEGSDFVLVNDRVKAIRETPRLQRANQDALKVGPSIKAGQDFDVRWLVQAADGDFYYITAFWSRVRAEDTERIADKAGVA